jgi:uncharacterized membrane protein YdjX (TVP38/TMEM64 family)
MTLNKTTKKILLLILLIMVIVAIRYSPAGGILTFENLKQHRESLVSFVQNRYGISVLVFITAYILVTAFSIPGAVVLTIAAGFLFGTLAATFYVNIGATIGATLAFLSARYLLGTGVQEKYQAQLKKFNEELEKNGTNYLLTLRLIPVFPFFLINFLSGLTKIPVRTFIWTTSLGIIPGTAVFAFAGRQIGTINSASEILSANVLAAFAVLALFALIPVIVKRIKAGRKGRRS